jgi:hypothetical protein
MNEFKTEFLKYAPETVGQFVLMKLSILKKNFSNHVSGRKARPLNVQDRLGSLNEKNMLVNKESEYKFKFFARSCSKIFINKSY